MKNLRTLALAALMVLPIAACDDDEGDGGGTTPDIVGSVTGSVSVEGTAIQGVTVTLAGATQQTTTTAADGSYSFQNVPGGTYTISLSNLPSDATFTNPTQTITISSTGQVASADFSGNFIRTAAITGVVLVDDEPAPGIAVTLSGTESGSTATDGLGTFAFTGLRAGDYAVAITSPNPDIQFGETTQNVTIAVGESASLVFAGLVPDEPVVSLFGVGTTAGNTACGAVVAGPGCTVAGSFSYIVNFDGGDETADRVSAYVSGPSTGGEYEEVAWQQFSTSGGAAAASDQVALFFNSASFDASTQVVDWVNGDYGVMVCMLTVEGTEVCATSSLILSFANTDVLIVSHESGGQGLVSGGVRWYGGEDVNFTAVARTYQAAIDIASIGISAVSNAQTGNGTAGFHPDVGAGHTGATASSVSPVVAGFASYTATVADNDGLGLGDTTPIEDSPAGTCSFLYISSVFDGDGVDILAGGAFAGATNQGLGLKTGGTGTAVGGPSAFCIDFTGPTTIANDEIEVNPSGAANDQDIDGVTAGAADALGHLAPYWFSSGVFQVDAISELGVGGINYEWDVTDLDATEPDPGNVASVDGLAERDATRTGATQAYQIEFVNATDDLGNNRRGGAVGAAGNDIAGPFGVDMGDPVVDQILPVPGDDIIAGTGPGDAGYFIFQPDVDHDGVVDALGVFDYDVDETALADNTAGSGIDDLDVKWTFQDSNGRICRWAADGTLTTVAVGVPAGTCPANQMTTTPGAAFGIPATATSTGGVTGNIDVTNNMFFVAGETDELHKAYQVTADNDDNSYPENDEGFSSLVIIDNQLPTTNMLNPPPGTVTSSNSSLTFTIQGTADDGSATLVDGSVVLMPLSSIEVSVRDPSTSGIGTQCEITDTLWPNVAAGGNVVANVIDVSLDQANGFSVNVTLQNPGAGPQSVCFFIESEDAARNNAGVLAPNTSDESALTVITWI